MLCNTCNTAQATNKEYFILLGFYSFYNFKVNYDSSYSEPHELHDLVLLQKTNQVTILLYALNGKSLSRITTQDLERALSFQMREEMQDKLWRALKEDPANVVYKSAKVCSVLLN